MANYTPDEMAAINAAARAGQLSDQDVRYFLSQMGAPMMPPTGAGATTDMEMQAYQDARPPGEMRPTGAGSTSDMEMQALQAATSPGEMRPTGAGATTERELRAYRMANFDKPGMFQANSFIDAMLGEPGAVGSVSDMNPKIDLTELQVLMEMIQRPEVADMLGALPGRGAITDQEMQGIK